MRAFQSTAHFLSRHLQSAILVCAMLGMTGCVYPTKKEERVIGFLGKARHQPFLAAQRALQEMGYSARQARLSEKLPSYGGTVMAPAQVFVSQGRIQQMLDWVKSRGGHLILLCQGGGSSYDDFAKEDHYHKSLASAQEAAPILKELRIYEKPATGSRPDGVNTGEEYYSFEMMGNLAYDCSAYLTDWRAGAKDAASLASFKHGSGRVTILAHAQPFRNRWIDEKDHMDILAALASCDPLRREFLIFSQSDVSLWDKLKEYAAIPMILLGVLVILWLWKYLPRFGPYQRAQEDNTRQFSDHLSMSGSFLWRRKMSFDLLESLRRAISLKLRRKHPHVGSDEEAQLARFAEVAQLPYDRVDAAWTSNEIRDPLSMARVVRDLQLIKDAL